MRKKILFFGLTGVLVSGAAIGGTVAATYIWKKQTTKTGVFSWAPAVLDAASKAEIGSKDYDAKINKDGRYFEYKSKGINYVFSSFEKLATFLNYQSFSSGFNVSTPTGSEFYGGFDSLKGIGISKNDSASLTKDFAPFTGDVSDPQAQMMPENTGSKIKIGGVTYYVVNKTKELKLNAPAWFDTTENIGGLSATPKNQFDTGKEYFYKDSKTPTSLYASEDDLLSTSTTTTTGGYPLENFGEVTLNDKANSAINGKYKFFPASAKDNPAYSAGVTPKSVDVFSNPTPRKVITVHDESTKASNTYSPKETYAYLNAEDFEDYKQGVSFDNIRAYSNFNAAWTGGITPLTMPARGGAVAGGGSGYWDGAIAQGGFFQALNYTRITDDATFRKNIGVFEDPRVRTGAGTRWDGATPPGFSFLLNGKPFHYYDALKGGGKDWWRGLGTLGANNASIQGIDADAAGGSDPTKLWYTHGNNISGVNATLKPIIGYNDNKIWGADSDPSVWDWQNRWNMVAPMYSIISTDITAFKIVDSGQKVGSTVLFKIVKVDPNDNYNELYFFGNDPVSYMDGTTFAYVTTSRIESQYDVKNSSISTYFTPVPSSFALLTKDNINKNWNNTVKAPGYAVDQSGAKHFMFEGDGTNSKPLKFDIAAIRDKYKIAGTLSYKLETTNSLVSYYDTDANKLMPQWDNLNNDVGDTTTLSEGNTKGGVFSLVTSTAQLESGGWQIAPLATHAPGWYRVKVITQASGNTPAVLEPVLLDGSKEKTGVKTTEPLAANPALLNKFKFLYKNPANADEYYTSKEDPATGYEKPSPALAGWFRETATNKYEQTPLAYGAWNPSTTAASTTRIIYEIIENANATYYTDVKDVKDKLKIYSTGNTSPKPGSTWNFDTNLVYEVHEAGAKNATTGIITAGKVSTFKYVTKAAPVTFSPLPGTTDVPSYLVTDQWDGTEAGLKAFDTNTKQPISHDDKWFKDLFLYDADMVSGTSDEEYFTDEKSLYAAAKVSPIVLAPGEKLYTDSHNEIISQTADENTLVNYGIGIFKQKDLKLTSLSGSDVIFIDNVEYHPVFE